MVIIFSKDFHLSMEIKKEYIWCLIGEQFLLKLLWKCTYVNSEKYIRNASIFAYILIFKFKRQLHILNHKNVKDE